MENPIESKLPAIERLKSDLYLSQVALNNALKYEEELILKMIYATKLRTQKQNEYFEAQNKFNEEIEALKSECVDFLNKMKP